MESILCKCKLITHSEGLHKVVHLLYSFQFRLARLPQSTLFSQSVFNIHFYERNALENTKSFNFFPDGKTNRPPLARNERRKLYAG